MLKLVKREVIVDSSEIKRKDEFFNDLKKFIKKNSLSTKKTEKQIKKFTHKIKLDNQMKKVTGFIYDTLSNIVLYNESSSEYYQIKGRIKKKRIQEKQLNNIDFSHVMINYGKNAYHKLPYYIYKELTKIKYISLNVQAEHQPDGNCEDDFDYDPLVMYENYQISSLNQLLNILPKLDGYITFGNRFLERDAWFDIFDWNIKVTVLYKNNTVITSDIRNFIEAYRLYK